MDVLPFLAVSVVLIVVPGPDMALVTRNALLGGRRDAILTSLGVALGLAAWSLAAAAGVAALLQRSEEAFLVLRVVGALYLGWLGLQALLHAWRRPGRETSRTAAAARARPLRALRQGLLSNLGNPKIAVFFTGFLPQFAQAGPAFVSLLALGLAFCVLTLVWLIGYALLAAGVGDVLRRPRIRRAVEAVTGTVLIALGVRLATAHR